ncbi:MAG: hypothetical protein ACOZHQ_14265 [Thermodesulfobacteriota bacterium]
MPMASHPRTLAPPERAAYYARQLVREAPRLLSALDRCPVSASGGSLDREWWAWASKDFANQDQQRGLWALAYLYTTPLGGNILHQEGALLGWIAQGVRFWLKSQDRRGAFDHLYPYESSWMAAAFTLADLVETYRLVGAAVDAETREAWQRAMLRAGDFLLAHDETHGFISNHRAGAAAALAGLSQVAGRTQYLQGAWRIMDGVYARQSPEGWFLEYEGADPGYQTLDTHYQALFYLNCGRDPRVLARVGASLEFLSYFMHPDGSIGGDYGSRNCPHFFPGGLEVFAAELPLAEAIAAAGAWGLEAGTSCGLEDSDTRNAFPLVTSYVLAHRALSQPRPNPPAAPAELPRQRQFERHWPQAGLYARNEGRRYLVAGLNKGGVVKLFDSETGELLHSSCGYHARQGGRDYTTLLWGTGQAVEFDPPLMPGSEAPCAPRRVTVRSRFYRFQTDRLMRPWQLIAFRLFMFSLGRVSFLNHLMRKHLIIKRFLTQRQAGGLTLERTLDLDSDKLVIDDLIAGPGAGLDSLREHGFFSTVYMASARYFRRQDLRQAWSSPELAEGLRGGRELRRRAYPRP